MKMTDSGIRGTKKWERGGYGSQWAAETFNASGSQTKPRSHPRCVICVASKKEKKKAAETMTLIEGETTKKQQTNMLAIIVRITTGAIMQTIM